MVWVWQLLDLGVRVHARNDFRGREVDYSVHLVSKPQGYSPK